MRKLFALVFNARAGGARPKLLDGVLSHLRHAGADVFQVATRSSDEATQRIAEIAEANAADAVIAAGGDGTFRAVAAGAAGTSLPVGFLPLGTGNVLAFEIGLTRNTAMLADGLLKNPDVPIRGGRVNDAPFFLMCGAGFDARIVQGLSYRAKRLLARAAYTEPVLRTLAHGAEMFDVEVDDRSYEASWVIVTRSSRYGGSFTLTRGTQLGIDPMLAIIMRASSRTALLQASAALAAGRLTDDATRPGFVTVVPAQHVIIGRHVQAPLQVDGDDAGTTPTNIVAEGPVVRVIVPPAYAAALSKRHTNRLL